MNNGAYMIYKIKCPYCEAEILHNAHEWWFELKAIKVCQCHDCGGAYSVGPKDKQLVVFPVTVYEAEKTD